MTEQSQAPNNIVKKANQMRKEMKDLEDTLQHDSLSCKHQGLQAVMRGDGVMTNIIIDPEHQNEPLQNFQKSLIELYNKAFETVENHRQNKLLNLLSDIQ